MTGGKGSMNHTEVLGLLEVVSASLEQAEASLMVGDCLAAIQHALEARRLCRQATASVLAECLRDLMVEAYAEPAAQSEEALEALMRVVRFAASELCSPCRQALGVMLKDGV